MSQITAWNFTEAYGRREANGAFQNGLWQVDTWVQYKDQENDDSAKERVVHVAMWVEANEAQLKQTIVDKDHDEMFGPKEDFSRLLRPFLLTVNQDDAFEIEYLPGEETELFEVMGGHGIYVEVSSDFKIKGTNGAG